MSEYPTQFGWQQLPDRDEALRLVYDFLRSLHLHELKRAGELVLVKDMDYFLEVLHNSLQKYLSMVIEDEDWEKYNGMNLALEIDDPDILKEEDTIPEFSGNQYVLSNNEDVSVQIGLRGQVTPIRVHFAVVCADELYFLKLQRITAQ
jgi:hypothetical protein